MLYRFLNKHIRVKLYSLLSISFLFFSFNSIAQISSGGLPYSFNNELKKSIVIQNVRGFAPSELNMLDSIEKKEKAKPYRFAREIPLQFNPDNSGSWETLPGGDRLWRLAIRSSGALSLYIVFDNYDLPGGAELFFYNPDKTCVLGAYTSLNNKADGILAVTPVPGDEIIIEYREPYNARYRGKLEIGQLGYDYKGFYQIINKYGDFGRSGSCNVDINCPEGEDWQFEKRAVCKIISRGLLGTGSLINNTRNDGKALFFTANHVIPSESRASAMIIYFNYESPVCNGGNGSLSRSLSNGTILATTDKLDFCLMELSTKPPKVYQPYYAGWDNTGEVPRKGICIHHPRGDVKKISIENNILFTGDYGSGFDTDSHWQVRAWDAGTTEPGSSGSPIFSENHFIVGDLTGGDASCEYNFDDYFQKFSRSWDDYSEPDKQLKAWLDPDNTGATRLYGYDPFDSVELIADFEWEPADVIVNHEVRFYDNSLGYPVEWKWEFDNADPEVADEEDPYGIIFNTPGHHSVKLIISKPNKTDTVNKTLWIGNMVDFNSDLTNIVVGGRVGFNNKSSGKPTYRKWIFEGGSPEYSDEDNPVITYNKAGTYSVSLAESYGNDTLFKLIDSYIEVVNANIIYNCNFISNISNSEHTVVDSIRVSTGYIPGTNSDNIVAYADKFIDTTGIPKEISRILVPVSKSVATESISYVYFTIWDESFNRITTMEYPLEQLIAGNEILIDFASPVQVDSIYYVGFELDYYISGDAFAVPMAVGRSDPEKNTLFVQLENEAWYSLQNYYNISTSLGIRPEVCSRDLKFEDNIILFPNPSSGIINISFGELVFKTFDIEIFDLSGQRIEYKVDNFHGDLSINMTGANSGIYLFKIRIDDLIISKKIILVR